MIKFQIECPNCKQKFSYNILGRDYDKIACPHCHKHIDVQLRYLLPVLSLAMFFFCYEIYDYALKAYLPIVVALLLGFVIAFIVTLLISQLLVKKFGDRILFETRLKTDKKVKKR